MRRVIDQVIQQLNALFVLGFHNFHSDNMLRRLKQPVLILPRLVPHLIVDELAAVAELAGIGPQPVVPLAQLGFVLGVELLRPQLVNPVGELAGVSVVADSCRVV